MAPMGIITILTTTSGGDAINNDFDSNCNEGIECDSNTTRKRSPLALSSLSSITSTSTGSRQQVPPATFVECRGAYAANRDSIRRGPSTSTSTSISTSNPSTKMRMQQRRYSSSSCSYSLWKSWILMGTLGVLLQVPSLSATPSPTPAPIKFTPGNTLTKYPSHGPTMEYSAAPTGEPSPKPSTFPSGFPSAHPSAFPSTSPSMVPSNSPSGLPSATPSTEPTLHPSIVPSQHPSLVPSSKPSSSPSQNPSQVPSSSPSNFPSSSPSTFPTSRPSSDPTNQPSNSPSSTPTSHPSTSPSIIPTTSPSSSPSEEPTTSPTITLSASPSSSPSTEPTLSPSVKPSRSAQPSKFPSSGPSSLPTKFPSSNPTSQPSDNPSSAPSPTPTHSTMPTLSPSLTPSSPPSKDPSSAPSSSPTASPSYSLQSFEFYIGMEFDILQNFEGKAKKIFEQEVDLMMEIILNADGENFSVVSSVERTEIVVPELESDGAARSRSRSRSLTSRTSLQKYGIGLKRFIQQSDTGLRVILQVFIDVRSGMTYDKEMLISVLKTGMDEKSERDTFIMALQTADNTFSDINVISKFTINDEEIPLVERPGPIPWAIIAPSIGAGALVMSVVGLLLLRRRRDSMSFVDGEFFDPPPPTDPRVSRTIEVEQDLGEISTLGDPVYPGGQNMFAAVQSFQTEDEETNRSSMSTDYDYKRAYGGVGDSPSVSTAGGNKSTFMPHASGQRSKQNEDDVLVSRLRAGSDMSSRIRSMSENISVFSEDNSFEAMYGEDERLVVIAPPGLLGMVIDTPAGGVPVVHAIKESSCLYNQIRIGDKLISVDDVDTTTLSAIRVSKLISARASNPQRVMVFLRSSDDP